MIHRNATSCWSICSIATIHLIFSLFFTSIANSSPDQNLSTLNETQITEWRFVRKDCYPNLAALIWDCVEHATSWSHFMSISVRRATFAISFARSETHIDYPLHLIHSSTDYIQSHRYRMSLISNCPATANKRDSIGSDFTQKEKFGYTHKHTYTPTHTYTATRDENANFKYRSSGFFCRRQHNFAMKRIAVCSMNVDQQ